jgi:LEA14-like dessication related protein
MKAMRTRAALALGVLTGCGLLHRAFETPKLTYRASHKRSMGLEGLQLDLLYDVENPNPVDVVVVKANVQLWVEDVRLAVVSPTERIVVPAKSTVQLTLPARVRFGDLYDSAITLRHKDTAHYRTEGTVSLETPVGVLDLPVSGEGDFDVPGVKDTLKAKASRLPVVRDLLSH